MTDISSINPLNDDSISHYTPTTEEVREIYFQSGYKTTPEQFDRWLAQVKAEAWGEGAKYVADQEQLWIEPDENPYRNS